MAENVKTFCFVFQKIPGVDDSQPWSLFSHSSAHSLTLFTVFSLFSVAVGGVQALQLKANIPNIIKRHLHQSVILFVVFQPRR